MMSVKSIRTFPSASSPVLLGASKVSRYVLVSSLYLPLMFISLPGQGDKPELREVCGLPLRARVLPPPRRMLPGVYGPGSQSKVPTPGYGHAD